MVKKSLEKTRRKFNTIKTIRLNLGELRKNTYFDQVYENVSFSFGLCSNIKEAKTSNGSVKLLTSLTSCRETLAGKILREVRRKDGFEASEWPTNKTCIIVSISTGDRSPEDLAPDTADSGKGLKKGKDSYEEWMLKSCIAGRNLINHFEKHNRWLRTKLYKIEHPLKTKRFLMYCFIGSKWWMLTPQALSLFTLFIRIGKYDVIRALGSNARREAVIETLNKFSKIGPSFDANKIRNPEKWIKFLDNYKIIFKGRKEIPSNWNSKTCQYDGIQNLVSGNCNDQTIQGRFNKLI